MSEKLSERTIAEGIVNRWIAAFRGDLSGKNASERLVDLIHAALEQQLAEARKVAALWEANANQWRDDLAAKDAEIARLRAAMQ